MKDKKLPLLKEIYVRIYDKNLVEKYEEVKNTRREKINNNEFTQELIKLGLTVLSTSKDSAESFLNTSNEIKRMLGVIIQELRKDSFEKTVDAEMNNKKLNAIHNIIVAQAKGETVTGDEIESGMYDTLPDRFIDEYLKNGNTNNQ